MKNTAFAACAAVLLLAAPVLGDYEGHTVFHANFDPSAGPNEYTVTFPPEFGSQQIVMPIVGGSFELEIDTEAGTSRLASWQQDISSIEIFGFPTGPITISILPGDESVGTYKPETQGFEVAATFRIEFDDSQLREFGFVSPVDLVGVEKGNIFGQGSIGSVSMFLEGEGLFAGGAFNYTCRTTARFEYLLSDDQAQPGDVNQDRALTVTDAIGTLTSLFQDFDVRCPLAREVNSDNEVDLSDAVYLLEFIYLGGPSTPVEAVPCG